MARGKVLSFADRVKIANYVQSLPPEKAILSDIVTHVIDELNIENVSHNHVRTVMIELGIKPVRKIKHRTTTFKPTADHHARQAVLAKAIRHIANELGITLPDGIPEQLNELVSRRRLPQENI